jgi:hypothetical protein
MRQRLEERKDETGWGGHRGTSYINRSLCMEVLQSKDCKYLIKYKCLT